jgi:hypothetical protein
VHHGHFSTGLRTKIAHLDLEIHEGTKGEEWKEQRGDGRKKEYSPPEEPETGKQNHDGRKRSQ